MAANAAGSPRTALSMTSGSCSATATVSSPRRALLGRGLRPVTVRPHAMVARRSRTAMGGGEPRGLHILMRRRSGPLRSIAYPSRDRSDEVSRNGLSGHCETGPMSAMTVQVDDTALPAAPPDWQLVATEGPGPFLTRATYRRPDGAEVEWTSRRHRKGQGLRVLTAPGVPVPAATRPSVPSRTWWISGLFAVGSLCFAVGALPAYL